MPAQSTKLKLVADNAAQQTDPVAQYQRVRRLTNALTEPLSDADATVQSMEDASPAKWHLAHTSWFFETFLLRDHLPGYRAFDDDFAFLFNSYYEAEGARHARPQRGMITRPTLDQVRDYRAHVDTAMETVLASDDPAVRDLVTLGLNHEQQHQELLITDIKHMFAQNPCFPAMWENDGQTSIPAPLQWCEEQGGRVAIGHDAEQDGFAFDCEGPQHGQLLAPFAIASRPVTNGEWRAFIADGGYSDHRHWLSDGWAWVKENEIEAPLYWQHADKDWQHFTLTGLQPLDDDAPVTHISLYEADAFASWAAGQWEGARLPTEGEWEYAMRDQDRNAGQQLDAAGPVHAIMPDSDTEMTAPFGSVWEWTGSAYRPYPRFRSAEGAVGEYNGKFMSGQFVLKGGSCATPRGHMRASYRNFFYPHQRWQFTGLRLARDI
ncbi:ergothioneine biosynthesis protein EgtB [Alterisphingorhabdus coralli]|uniref:Ergothioneine biosynthesis protein EgtB n=1 Tax=Alterisphingorhabdus coralli TaxID=3071408 RepID=A0AA97F9N4_9SPHN|nr:ergothioneine biosynthesis protein EgtB [Parasphingorhabdus sp. SCSIO 66989]WOE75817.1 ergothioneine biosynthesis protein EgtB [Parasphingorhabdus sp. SCSIO 66989]